MGLRSIVHAGLVTMFAVGLTRTTRAHETDQYSVPAGRDFADLGGYFSDEVRELIAHAVEKTNRRIESSFRDGQPSAETQRLQSPDEIAFAVLWEFPAVTHYVETLEFRLHAPAMKDRFPGLVTAYRPSTWIYHHPALVIDPTKFIRLWRTSTVMIDGTYLGTDKIVHFVHMGYLYFKEYRAAIAKGMSIPEAERASIDIGTQNNPFLSEKTFLGMFATGVWSNGDLAADYCGLKFFRNLTEPVRIRGETQPPMLVKHGAYWQLADHVRHGDFFRVFVSDHWDEALNPNDFTIGIGLFVKQELQKRCDDLLNWYVDAFGRPMTREQFRGKSNELKTYFGEDYGFRGDLGEMVSVANVCFDDDPRRDAPSIAAGAASRDAFGRTPLWWAVHGGKVSEVDASLARGVDVNAADLDRETPLHVAARLGHTAIAERLIQRGAAVNAAALYGMTPLHLAVQRNHHDVAAILLRHRADANARDEFGCTPLHDAASRGDPKIVGLLLKSGALATARDIHGTTPLHRAARAGATDVAKLLLGQGADLLAQNEFGRRPADEADHTGHAQVARLLRAPQGRTAAKQ